MKFSNRIGKDESGATLVEVAIGMGIFLVLLFLLLEIGLVLHVRSSFTIAVGDGLRLGLSRGDPYLTGGFDNLSGTIADVDTWMHSTNAANKNDAEQRLLDILSTPAERAGALNF